MRVKNVLLISSLILLPLSSLWALSIGSVEIVNVWSYIFDPGKDGNFHQIIWEIRFPRVAMALLVGAALGVAGALSQAATNNPLADPAIIGTSAGATLGATSAIMLNFASIGSLQVIVAATLGALFITWISYQLSHSPLQLLVIGIAISALVSAVVGLLITIADRADARSLTFWSSGSLALTSEQNLSFIAPIIVVTLIAAILFASRLDLLILGDSSVSYLGTNPRHLRGISFALVALLIGASVSVVGSIAFLALAVPHVVRALIGPSNRGVVIGSAILGALLLLLADTAARSIAPPHELPIGLITAMLGAPVLIIILKKSRQVWR